MDPSQTFKTYLHSLLVITSLGASLANYFVFYPQNNNSDTTQETIHMTQNTQELYEPTLPTINHTNKLLYLLIILLLATATLSLRKFWQARKTTNTSSQTSHPCNTSANPSK